MIQKSSLPINFSQGLDTKTDPFQVAPGKMLSLQNSIFTKGGLLQKRNGFDKLTPITGSYASLTAYSGSLVALGTSLSVLSENNLNWFNKGTYTSIDLSVVTGVRKSTGQTSVDTIIASNGLACIVTYDTDSNSYYQIVDSANGQILVGSTQLPATAQNPRVFILGVYFVVTFLATVTGTPHLQYIAIPINNITSPGSATDISTQVSGLSAGYDGIVANNNLYLAWNGSDGGGAIRLTYISQTFTVSSPVIIAGKTANLMSVTADTSGSSPVIWATFWNSGDSNAWSVAYSPTLVSILSSTKTINTVLIDELTSSASGNVLTLFYETSQNYAYASIASDLVSKVTCTIAGVVGSPTVILRGVGLASKSFFLNSSIYMMVAYGGSLQPTYFLIDSSGKIIAKLAYSNGGGYSATQVLPQANVSGSSVSIGYLFKDLLASINRGQGAATSSGIYSQTGVNIAQFKFGEANVVSSEIAHDLHLTGGFLWMYDGVKPVEHGFHVWPEDLKVTTSTSGGHLTDQQYYYYATYEWTDAQGNLHRSAPSVPYGQVTTGGGTSTNTIKVPTLRLTAKTQNNLVRIVLYRWSTNQPIPYQVTSITSPVANDPTVDNVTITDTLADSSILGNVILYTNGGVIENIGAPACLTTTLYKSRLFLVDSEDKNLLWFSKQVIESIPVEMSDLLTLYIAPTAGAQGDTGPITALSAMDDKLIIFKRDAIYYITGNGPDNTGSNNDFSEPVFISSTIGCSNQNSIVFQPQGLMFQSDKGIWLLGRDLSTTYIGAPVEAYNSYSVESSLNIPGTNQVRFTMSNGITLMFDYFYNQWGTFTNVPAISSVLYQGMHTYLDQYGRIFQETPGAYLDGSSPVLLSLTTSWLNLAGLQGYERAYCFYLLGGYLSPHKLQVQIAYDYNPSFVQSVTISPDNFSPDYGGDSYYGGGNPFGGTSSVEQWRVFLSRQKCEAFQIQINEIYDPSFGVPAGAGLTLSGIDLIVGSKSSYPRLSPTKAVG